MSEHTAEKDALTTCDEGVTRRGEFQPCEAVPVAVRLDEEGHWYAVCARHVRAPMVPLSTLLTAFARGWDARALPPGEESA